MSTAEQYLYHAPDSRIYGPADRNTLLKWEEEGRLTSSSKLVRKGESQPTTWEKVRITPPVCPPPSVTTQPNLLSTDVGLPPLDVSAAYFRPESLVPFPSTGSIFIESAQTYSKNFWKFLLFGALLQVPSSLMGYAMSQGNFSDHLAQSTRFALAFLLAIYCVIIFKELVFGMMLVWMDRLRTAQTLSFSETLTLIQGAILHIALSIIPRVVLPALATIPALLAGMEATKLNGKSSDLVVGLLLIMSFILMIPPLLLIVRLLLTSGVILLEGREGISALKRSNALVRYNSGQSFFSSGEVRIFLLIMVPAILYMLVNIIGLAVLGYDFSSTGSVVQDAIAHPKTFGLLKFETILFLGGTLINPLFAVVVYHYYSHATEHVKEV